MIFKEWLQYRINEMGVTPQDQDGLKTIINKLVQGDMDWMKEKDILVGDKGSFWILNYGMKDKNEFNRLVRGLVVQKPQQGFSGNVLQLIKSFPFIRFFNQDEPQADKINMNNSEMLEKMDGSMVGLFFPNGDPKDPHWHTRKMLSSHQPDLDLVVGGFGGGQYKFMQIIGQYVRQLNFNEEDTYHTYVFEFIHTASAVLTKYKKEQYGLYLLAGRNLQTHNEESENSLDEIAARIGARRPSRWDAVADEQQISQMMEKIASEIEDFEGMVFRDRETGKRIKLKDPGYVEKHHLLGDLSFKRLVPQVLDGEENEIIAYFPQAKKLVDEIKNRHKDFKEKTIETIKAFRAYKDLPRKELWTKANDAIKEPFIKSCVMRHLETEDLNSAIEEELRKMATTTFDKKTYAGTQTFRTASGKYLDMIGLKDNNVREI